MTETYEIKKDTASIEMREVIVRFNRKPVLNGFSLVVQKGEKVVITGASGAGKSTILRTILGFVVPESGTIHILGEQLTPKTVWHLRTYLGYVPQEPELGSGSVRNWLEMPFSYRANRRLKKNLEMIPDMFHKFLLPLELLDKDVSTLSGGEKQRIAIVSALLLQRPILLLDEPTSALDEMSKRVFAELLNSSELTVLMITHDRELQKIGDREIHIT